MAQPFLEGGGPQIVPLMGGGPQIVPAQQVQGGLALTPGTLGQVAAGFNQRAQSGPYLQPGGLPTFRQQVARDRQSQFMRLAHGLARAHLASGGAGLV